MRALCRGHARVAIMIFKWHPGGHEALVQLALAFEDSIPGRELVTSNKNISYHGMHLDYADIKHIPQSTLEELCPGDILIVPEVMAKRLPLTHEYIQTFVWQLADKPERVGYEYIYHNH